MLINSQRHIRIKYHLKQNRGKKKVYIGCERTKSEENKNDKNCGGWGESNAHVCVRWSLNFKTLVKV